MQPERARYAIIEVGSNSVDMVVYDRLGRAPVPLFSEKIRCRLGDGLARTGVIAEEGCRRALEAVRRFRAIADAMGVARLDVIATEALRSAANGAGLAAQMSAAADADVRILSGAEEAGISAMGVLAGCFAPVGLVGDMGGGSLEFAETMHDHIGTHSASLPLGSLAVLWLLAEGRALARRRINLLLRTSLPRTLAKPVFYAVGGAWRNFARVQMAAADAPVGVVDLYTLDTQSARDFAKYLQRVPAAKLGALPGMAEDIQAIRALPAAALVLDCVLEHLAPERVVFSTAGLREGWTYAQLHEDDRCLDPLIESARNIGLPMARVPGFARALALWTARLFPEERPADQRLRLAVCALSDMAWRDHPDVRAEQSYRRLLTLPLIGADHFDRVFLASAMHARYLGRPDAPWLFPTLDLLSIAAQRRAGILGNAIRVAYRLSGGVPDVLADFQLRSEADRVVLEVGEDARVPNGEAVTERLNHLAAAIGVGRSEVETIRA